jgi:serine/threonine protein phosphatase 1
MHERYEINKKGRDFVIGDLHGCYDLFMELLEKIEFKFHCDRMFSVGDLIDRGNKNIECLRLIKEYWFHSVQGNHEDMLISHIIDGNDPSCWMANGGQWIIGQCMIELTELAHLAKALPLSITVETENGGVGICHAQPPTLNWLDAIEPDERSKQIMLWARMWIEDKDMDDIENAVMTFHGHTPVNEPKQIGNVNFIDTGAVFTGTLSCVEL